MPPLVAAEVDLRDFQFMPLLISRLFGSEFHAKAKDSEWRAGMTLWLKSWHQVPAASVPNEDTALARLAEFGRDVKAWLKVKAMALYGWILCDDDRWYHPVVAEEANKAWDRRLEFIEKQASKTERQQRWRDHVKAVSARLRELGVVPPMNASMKRLDAMLRQAEASTEASRLRLYETPTKTDVGVYKASHETALTGTGTGTGTVEPKSLNTPSGVFVTAVGGDPASHVAETPEELLSEAVGCYRVPPCDFTAIVDAYHVRLPTAPRVDLLNEQRRRKIRMRWREMAVKNRWACTADGVAFFKEFFGYVADSKFLTGRTKAKDRAPFVADLAWLMGPENFLKVYEGRYQDD